VCDCVLKFVRERASGSILLENFVRNKAISRQYHTWFRWEDNNANYFFGLFGTDFRIEMSKRVKESPRRPYLKAMHEIWLREPALFVTLLGIAMMTLLPVLVWLGFITLVKFLWQHWRFLPCFAPPSARRTRAKLSPVVFQVFINAT
jgi:hypothetical protein